ncbi:MAG: NAD(P)-dependent oxidoreductase [Gammaproteobacteria bacterium]|nr:NAD(P)-dependent oxidoreductase [Gammaproteobacteria bacterium]
MKVLIVGGSGYVGALTLPLLSQLHDIRVFDIQPPADGPWEYLQGDIADLDKLNYAARETDALIYMAMGVTDNDGSFKSTAAIEALFDVNVRGLYYALNASRNAGCLHAVYISSMSIYKAFQGQQHFKDEGLVPNPSTVYGLTKSLGEEICRYAVRSWAMDVNVLRLCLPISMEQFNANDDHAPAYATAGDDVARAIIAALEYSNGFESFMISGDRNHLQTHQSKARLLLNWEPLPKPAQFLPS